MWSATVCQLLLTDWLEWKSPKKQGFAQQTSQSVYDKWCYQHKPECLNDIGGHRRCPHQTRLPGQRHTVLGDISDLRLRWWAWKLVLIVVFHDDGSSWFWNGQKKLHFTRVVLSIRSNNYAMLYLWLPKRRSRKFHRWSWWPHTCKFQSPTANVQRNKHAYVKENSRKANSADTKCDDSSNNTFNRRASAAITESKRWNSERWRTSFTSSPCIGQIACHLWVPYSADANFLMNSIFHSPPSHCFALPSSFPHRPVDHNKDKLINLGWALLEPPGPMTAGLSPHPSLELWLFVGFFLCLRLPSIY